VSTRHGAYEPYHGTQERFACAGFCFGRTPLIKLSPKKTWEGFIGGFAGTLVIAFYLAGLMSHFKWMTCPRKVSRPHLNE
jgi:hypothetical protein